MVGKTWARWKDWCPAQPHRLDLHATSFTFSPGWKKHGTTCGGCGYVSADIASQFQTRTESQAHCGLCNSTPLELFSPDSMIQKPFYSPSKSLKQVVRYRNLDMSDFHFRLWTWAVAAIAWAVGELNLSLAEQVSQGGEPAVDMGDPFGLLGYDCRWLKLERVRQGFFRGRFWIPIRKSRTKRLTEPATFNFNVYKHILIY
jgi:hypothetical protein